MIWPYNMLGTTLIIDAIGAGTIRSKISSPLKKTRLFILLISFKRKKFPS